MLIGVVCDLSIGVCDLPVEVDHDLSIGGWSWSANRVLS